MVVRDLFQSCDDARVIARAIFEDRCEQQDIAGWIIKYYAQLVKLKETKVRKSNMMFYLSVLTDDRYGKGIYGNVSGFAYEDIKEGKECYLAIEGLGYRQYASLYVPDYMVQRYGEEVVASEALREYGWNGFDEGIVCPDEVKNEVYKALSDMKQEIFLTDKNYYDRCRLQFRKAYEGKKVPQWSGAKTAEGVKDNRSDVSHSVLL